MEQIAPSPAALACTCCEDFCGCRAKEGASEIPGIFYAFGPQLNVFMSVGICLSIFVVSCFSMSEVRHTVSNLCMSRFISLTKLCSSTSFTRASRYSTLSLTYVEDTRFFIYKTAKKLVECFWYRNSFSGL